MVTCPIEINENSRILIIAPHPDDESIGVGGLINSYPDKCQVMVMTDGRYGDNSVSPMELAAIREKEFINAMKVAGVSSYHMFNVEDGSLINNENVFDSIDYGLYTHIFLPYPYDNHSDHLACYEYAVKRVDISKAQIYQYEVHIPMPGISHHMDITGLIEKKCEMIDCHSSQMKIHLYSNQVKSLAQYRGFQNDENGKYLEVYNRVEDVSIDDSYDKTSVELSKYKIFTRYLTRWMDKNKNGEGIGRWLAEKGYGVVAIYGYGVLGRVLVSELENTNCEVSCIIDRNKKIYSEQIKVYHDIADISGVEAVVVTVLDEGREIADSLIQKGIKSIYLYEYFDE